MTDHFALEDTILRVLVGSQAHGTSLAGQEDRDELGVCIEPPEYVIGLQRFDQYVERTQPEGHRSQPGDLDRTTYSLRKYVSLVLRGNPSIIETLFTSGSAVLINSVEGDHIRTTLPKLGLSRQAGGKYLGYMTAQRDKLLGLRGGMNVSRPELVEAHGFDTKYAYHMVRLGMQGVELLTTGEIILPIPEPNRSVLLELRRGEMTLAHAIEWVITLEEQLIALLARDDGPLPAEPNWWRANLFLTNVYHAYWARTGEVTCRVTR